MAKNSEEFINELRLASYILTSNGLWIERNGLILPKNICTEAADIIEWMTGYIELLESAVEELKEQKIIDLTRL